MASLQARLLRVVLRTVVRRELARHRYELGDFVAAVRRTFELGAFAVRTPGDVRIVAIASGDVCGEWIVPRGASARERAILYVHGGGMVACRPPQYRTMTVPLARLTQVPVFAVDYRHAPEHPFPAALDDTLAAYAALRARIPADGIVIAGDSAGGNLALAVVLALRERSGVARPVAGIIAISPWTDLAATGASHVTNEASDDLLVAPRDGVSLADAYAPRARWNEPFVSPLYGDYAGSPPLLAFASGSEMLLDDARALVARIRAQGGVATLVQGDGLPHAWPIFPMLPEARAAHATMADFVARVTAPA
ncbi:MAG: alpha/beta hydrolase [Vulcanimicrobiaceae bacterium]